MNHQSTLVNNAYLSALIKGTPMPEKDPLDNSMWTKCIYAIIDCYTLSSQGYTFTPKPKVVSQLINIKKHVKTNTDIINFAYLLCFVVQLDQCRSMLIQSGLYSPFIYFVWKYHSKLVFEKRQLVDEDEDDVDEERELEEVTQERLLSFPISPSNVALLIHSIPNPDIVTKWIASLHDMDFKTCEAQLVKFKELQNDFFYKSVDIVNTSSWILENAKGKVTGKHGKSVRFSKRMSALEKKTAQMEALVA